MPRDKGSVLFGVLEFFWRPVFRLSDACLSTKGIPVQSSQGKRNSDCGR